MQAQDTAGSAIRHHFEAIAGALETRRQADELVRRAQERMANAVWSARKDGLQLAEIAEMAGITKQAVSQMLKRQERRERAECEEQEHAKRDARRLERLARPDLRGLVTKAFPCPHCGRFKSKPSDRCFYCGDEMGSHNGSAHELNRAYGYAS